MSHQMIEQRQNSALAQSEMGDKAVDQQAAVHVDVANCDEDQDFLLSQDDSQMKGKSPTVSGAASGGSYLSSPAFLRELIVSVFVFWFGWYVPKYLRRRYGVYQRQVPYQVLAKSGDIVLDPSLNHPYVGLDDVVITSEMLIATCVWMPLVVLAASGYFFNRTAAAAAAVGGSGMGKWVESHTGACVLLVAVGLSEFTTQTVKARVGRLRPNFYGMCGFDLDALECTASAKRQLEARQSFPSGHSSLSVAGMTVLALFFLGRAGLGRIREKRKDADYASVGSTSSLGRSQVLSFASATFPLAYATYVATSRLVDDWHHVSDVVAGCVIGFVSASFAYHLFFPFVMSDLAGIPHRLLCGSAYRV